MMIPIEKPRTKPAITAFDRNVDTQPIRSSPENQVHRAGHERQGGRVSDGLVRPQRGRAGERRDHCRRHRRDGGARALHQVPRRPEDRIDEQADERGVEPVLHRHAREGGVREALRDQQRPDRQSRHGVRREPAPVVRRQPADDREEPAHRVILARRYGRVITRSV